MECIVLAAGYGGSVTDKENERRGAGRGGPPHKGLANPFFERSNGMVLL